MRCCAIVPSRLSTSAPTFRPGRCVMACVPQTLGPVLVPRQRERLMLPSACPSCLPCARARASVGCDMGAEHCCPRQSCLRNAGRLALVPASPCGARRRRGAVGEDGEDSVVAIRLDVATAEATGVAVAVTSPRVRVLRPSFARSAFLRVLSNEAVARSRSPARSRSISPQPVKMRCEVKSTVV